MNFNRVLRCAALSMLLISGACSAEKSPATPAPAAKPATPAAAGEQYSTLAAPVQTEVAPGQVEVLEFFLYSCPHCYHFEPAVSAWEKKLPGHAVFKRVPANFGPNAAVFARAHYTAEALGVLGQFRPALFKAIQEDKRSMDSEAALALVFKAATGIDEKKFSETFNSFAVDNQVRRADALARAYALTGVPALAVAGKYLISPRQGGHDGMLNTADMLVERERIK